MAEQRTDRQPADLMQAWRDWLTQSERQFNTFFNDMMGTESFARGLGSYMEVYALSQRMVAQGMERYLQFMNLPSRNDITNLGDAIQALEERLARIESRLETPPAVRGDATGAAAPEEPAEAAAPAQRSPRRTRRPPRRS
ncbi:MAG: hypothetical protein HYS09_10215 [Chloroflexi bacterium]|nr:hypothetical protein [Chloroflexota bacterium]